MMTSSKAAVGLAALLGAAALTGCGDREAEGETPVAEAEVSTDLPETVISDERLEATANAAAEVASTPPAQVVVVPVPGGAPQANQQATGATAPATSAPPPGNQQ